MNPGQIDRLMASVPDTLEDRVRERLDGYAATARRCDERISAVRAELEQTLRRVGGAAHEGDPAEAADEALQLAMTLEQLERIQPRVDAWLRAAVIALADERQQPTFGEGPA